MRSDWREICEDEPTYDLVLLDAPNPPPHPGSFEKVKQSERADKTPVLINEPARNSRDRADSSTASM